MSIRQRIKRKHEVKRFTLAAYAGVFSSIMYCGKHISSPLNRDVSYPRAMRLVSRRHHLKRT